jgi:hypothetical protein
VRDPHPAFGTPLPVAAATEGTGVREVSLIPTCRDYILSPRQVGTDLFNELLTQDARLIFCRISAILQVELMNTVELKL